MLSQTWSGTDRSLKEIGTLVSRRRDEHTAGSVRYGSIHFDGSISLRSPETRLAGKTWLAHPDDLVFSKIDIRNGAIGLVPNDSDPIGFSSEYPIYDVSGPDRLVPEYLHILCRTSTFRSQVEALTVGHSGRRRITPENFEALKVPVPDRQEQIRIAAEYSNEILEASRLSDEADLLEKEGNIEFLSELGIEYRLLKQRPRSIIVGSSRVNRWTLRSAFESVQGASQESSKYDLRALGSNGLSVLKRGVSKSPRNRPDRHPRPYIRVANIQKWGLDLSDVREIDVPPNNFPAVRISSGNILICRNNSLELVGKAAMWRGEISECTHDDHVFRLEVNIDALDPRYVNAYLATPVARTWFQARAQMTTNLAGIAGDAVTTFPIPIPPLHIQAELGERMDEIRDSAQGRRKLSRELSAQALINAERSMSSS
ncbi:hypothetical protein [Nocardia neocaledoniensis]|uniref:hypothetical protein n=1 Tax=Nocardia neocaledoniensis TaxID=236511 RepID=UPI0011BFD6AD|nr:hypothetical protein [Nocardia neocaledoniensis]